MIILSIILNLLISFTNHTVCVSFCVGYIRRQSYLTPGIIHNPGQIHISETYLTTGRIYNVGQISILMTNFILDQLAKLSFHSRYAHTLCEEV